MSWAGLYAKAKDNHARSYRVVWRTKFLVLGFILAGAGGFGLYSDTKHQLDGRPATATLLEHVKACKVEYQRIGEEKRQETWPCELAEEFQRRVGSNKIKISRDFMARVQFSLANGRMHEASVDESKLDSFRLPVGATLPVVYAPGNPADVRAVLSWDRLKILIGLFAVGSLCLALALGAPLGRLIATIFAWAFRGRTPQADDEAVVATAQYRALPETPAPDLDDSINVPRRRPAPATVNAYPRAALPGARASFGMRK